MLRIGQLYRVVSITDCYPRGPEFDSGFLFYEELSQDMYKLGVICNLDLMYHLSYTSVLCVLKFVVHDLGSLPALVLPRQESDPVSSIIGESQEKINTLLFDLNVNEEN